MDRGAKMHLREWLIAQVESGGFEGVRWEDAEKTMFRIPWKHASKKDYRQTEDAALFKAWAVHKGKYREGRGTDNPTMWKTRLRCALNKSTDFKEVPERNQLDITEPYKVYRIQSGSGASSPQESTRTKDPLVVPVKASPKSPGQQLPQGQKESSSKDDEEEKASPVQELNRCPMSVEMGSSQPADSEHLKTDHVYCEFDDEQQKKQHSAFLTTFRLTETISDFRMRVALLYQGQEMTSVTTVSEEGCFILQGHQPLGCEEIYGTCTTQQISFPLPEAASLPAGTVEAMSQLLCHLEKGVLVWVAPEGMFIKRFCQGRVYWSGPLARHADQPNKLEREKTFKLFDTSMFLNGVQKFLQGKGPAPSYKIELCFGQEYPDPNVPKSKKLIMAQVVPVFAEELLRRFKSGGTEKK